MAILKSQFPVTGSMGEFSFYTIRGSDKIIVRRKGGPSRKDVLKSERFAHSRLNMSEFRGRVRASQFILKCLHPLRLIRDYNFVNGLHKPLKAIQDLDTVSLKGRRNIEISRKPMFLEGITLNKKNAFDSVIQTSLVCSFHHETIGATVAVPELIPGVNFFIPRQYPYYRIIVCLAIVPDLHFSESGFVSAAAGVSQTILTYDKTQWLRSGISSPELTFNLKPERDFNDEALTYIVSAGIEYGAPAEHPEVKAVKHQGAGKILRTRRVKD